MLRARRMLETELGLSTSNPFDRFEWKLRLVSGARGLAIAVLVIALVAAFTGVFSMLLAWVTCRRHEIALLKAQGGADWWVAGTYLVQAVVCGAAASAIGVAAAYLLCPRVTAVTASYLEKPEIFAALLQPTLADPGWLVLLTTIACFGAALLPALRAVRQDPWEILREAE